MKCSQARKQIYYQWYATDMTSKQKSAAGSVRHWVGIGFRGYQCSRMLLKAAVFLSCMIEDVLAQPVYASCIVKAERPRP